MSDNPNFPTIGSMSETRNSFREKLHEQSTPLSPGDHALEIAEVLFVGDNNFVSEGLTAEVIVKDALGRIIVLTEDLLRQSGIASRHELMSGKKLNIVIETEEKFSLSVTDIKTLFAIVARHNAAVHQHSIMKRNEQRGLGKIAEASEYLGSSAQNTRNIMLNNASLEVQQAFRAMYPDDIEF